MKVRILKSPYSSVKKGSVGTLESKKFEGYFWVYICPSYVQWRREEAWRVKVGNESRLFRPYELRVLEERE